MKWALFVIAVCAPVSAQAQVNVSGPASVIDGDTLQMGDFKIRLHGIDAPEAAQTCDRSGEVWECGREATEVLTQQAIGKKVVCEQRDTDVYGRMVARCKIDRMDLAEFMVSSGYAVALPEYSEAYVETEAQARARQVGLWASVFQPPKEYRAAQRETTRANAPQPRRSVSSAPALPRPAARSSAVYFRNCSEARAAGAAPLYRGTPGYRPQMDGDGDGVACEPYRRR